MKKTRTIKATETGDHWKGKTIPRILLQGKWLEEAGFPPGINGECDNPIGWG